MLLLATLPLLFASLALAQTCSNYGNSTGSSCLCPPGFNPTGVNPQECNSPVCGGSLYSPAGAAPAGTGSLGNVSAGSCGCATGFTGPGCTGKFSYPQHERFDSHYVLHPFCLALGRDMSHSAISASVWSASPTSERKTRTPSERINADYQFVLHHPPVNHPSKTSSHPPLPPPLQAQL